MLSDRVQRLGLSPTLRIGALAQKLRAEGVDLVDLSVGEPDFPTPDAIVEAGAAALAAGHTKYAPSDGVPALRAAIAAMLREERGVAWDASNVLVSPGAKSSLYNVAMALLSSDDEVIIPSPFWVSYPEQALLAGARPVFVATRESDGFQLAPEDLAGAITSRTRALVLNAPSNPTGAVYDVERLREIARICVDHDVIVISDEIYSRLVYDGARYVSIASLGEEIRERTVIVDGFSKAYSMTGWRLGWAAGPRDLIEACSRVQSHVTSGAATFTQMAALVALDRCAPDVERMRAEFQQRRDLVVAGLRRIPGLTCTLPGGAFYAFPNVRRYLGRYVGDTAIHGTTDLAEYLLEEARVAVVPGEAFGSSSHLRLSFATSEERLREGLDRMAEALARQP